ncbi:inositol monophosphatase family protein [uncultured Muribaculum sp.]|uniref:inositol monophosphatase family protein n=1 Tax=uncultured Muribaculum sp. TaxID=1918613 RepID=UPI0025AFC68C|nr:inositol monophosphatase family protein [uncultured Muribaculum sp.]
MDYNSMLLNALQWARQAGAVQLGHFRQGNLDIRTKATEADVVTIADRESERLIIDGIHAAYPGHAILSEESGEEAGSGSGWRWIIDPLDGTTNYSQGLPLFSVSIALEHDGQVVTGVVYAPYTDELFHAVRGEGAFLNGRPISVAGKERLAECVVSTGFPVDKHQTADNNLDNVSRIMPQVRGLRRLGSAAIDICYVAAGFLDGYWELNLHRWDVAAAELILAEAGGVSSRFRPDRGEAVVAGSPKIHDSLKSLLSATAPL